MRPRPLPPRNPLDAPLRVPDEHWRIIFSKYDRNNDGHICVAELDHLLQTQEYEQDVPDYVVKRVHSMADKNKDGVLDMEEFVDMIHHPDWQHLFGHFFNRYVHMLVPRRAVLRMTRARGEYEDEYSCCPPPVGMILISVIEIIFYSIDAAKGSTLSPTGPVALALVYNPHRRYEAWRYMTYMFVHIGIMHLVVNLCVQVLLGSPLEMVHKWWRVLIVYFAGVLAGSLGTSVTDPTVLLAGASGGVYSLLTAHIATIIMNWKEMEYPLIQLVIFLVIAVCDLGTAIHDRYVKNVNNNIGYAAHLAGALAGLLVGMNVLRNLDVTKTEKIMRKVSFIVYIGLMGIAIVWNIAYSEYFPAQDYSKL